MSKSSFESVDAYIATQPEDVRATLERVRATIRRAVPRAEERISYQMPAYALHGENLVYFAGWKQHYALYPVSASVRGEFAEDLAPYELSRGTIRFPLAAPVPVKLIAAIAKFRAAEAEASWAVKAGKAGKAAKRKPR